MSELGSPELAAEQAHLKRATEVHARTLQQLLTGSAGAGDEIAFEVLERMRMERIRVYTRRSGPLYFGRIDRDVRGTAYIGRHAIMDGRDMLAMNWRAPAAAPFYSATVDDREGISLRRRFDIADDTLLGFVDEVFDGGDPDSLTAAIIDDILKRRSGTMGQIVATITPEQNSLIRAETAPALIVQGGPGTGKTAVGLHRAAWLLYDKPDCRRLGVLIVGPNAAFMRYIGQVLPALGEDAVEQRELRSVIDRTADAGDEPHALTTLKGSARIATVLDRLLWDGIDTSATVTLEPEHRGPQITIAPDDLRELVGTARTRRRAYRPARAAFRDLLAQRVASRFVEQSRTPVLVPVEDLVRQIARDADFKALVTAVWPTRTVKSLVSALFKPGDRLRSAAAGLLSEEEQVLLTRARAPKAARDAAPADAVIFDEAEWLIDAGQRVYAHVVVDEAQNLTEMELRMITRRGKAGSITLLGDIDQRTTDATHNTWAGLTAAADIASVAVQTLPTSYRVPTGFLAAAAEILSDKQSVPAGVREADVPPLAIQAEDVFEAAIRLGEAWTEVGATALILPPSLIDAARDRLERIGYVDAAVGEPSGGLNLFDIESMKGLEVDAVIVVEPTEILEAPVHGGVGALYTALTRSTQRLAMVHSGGLPPELQGSAHLRHAAIDAALALG